MRIYLHCGMIAATIGTSLHVILALLLANQAPSPLLTVLLSYGWAWILVETGKG